jgi:hypothetical protein
MTNKEIMQKVRAAIGVLREFFENSGADPYEVAAVMCPVIDLYRREALDEDAPEDMTVEEYLKAKPATLTATKNLGHRSLRVGAGSSLEQIASLCKKAYDLASSDTPMILLEPENKWRASAMRRFTDLCVELDKK